MLAMTLSMLCKMYDFCNITLLQINILLLLQLLLLLLQLLLLLLLNPHGSQWLPRLIAPQGVENVHEMESAITDLMKGSCEYCSQCNKK